MWGEPWSIVAEHPANGEPFGLVITDESTFTEAEDLARQLLATFRLTGAYIPTRSPDCLEGHYLFTYTTNTPPRWHLATIWAASAKDADLRLNILAAEGILFMPTSG